MVEKCIIQCYSTNMKVQVLASGSKGNVTLVLCDETKLIIDIGLSFLTVKRMLEEKKLTFEDFQGILITHCHSDHIKGLSALIKHTNLPVIIPKEMYIDLENVVPKERCKFVEDNFSVDNVNIELIHTSHDTNYSVGYIIEYKNKELVYVTDTGYINRKYLRKIINKDIYVIESNHDEVMLMDGPYPRFLKERVISDKGHLSNKTTAKYLKNSIGEKTKYIVLAHLSEKNNTENLAYQETKQAIENDNIKIMIAKQDEELEPLEV